MNHMQYMNIIHESIEHGLYGNLWNIQTYMLKLERYTMNTMIDDVLYILCSLSPPLSLAACIIRCSAGLWL